MRRFRSFCLVLTPLLWLAVAGWVALDWHYHPCFTAGPMVQMVQSDSFALTWRLHPPVNATLEVIGPDGSPAGVIHPDSPPPPDDIAPIAADGSSGQPAAGRAGALTAPHRVVSVTGLTPGTTYRYRLRARVWGRDTILHEDTVTTAPRSTQPFRFIAFGDSGDAGLAQRRVAARISAYEPDLLIHTGDLVYNFGAPEDYPSRFYHPYADIISHVPFYPCLGNHDFRTDDGQPLLDAFVLPRNGPPEDRPERNFWFDYGPVRFVAIDSNHHYDELQRIVAPWLDGVLADAGSRWKIVFFHEPPYTNGRYVPADKIIRAIVPVLDRHGVQLVLSGHNHMYERTHPLRHHEVLTLNARQVSRPAPATSPSTAPAGAPATPTTGPSPPERGTIYITTGAGGARLYDEHNLKPGYVANWYDRRHSFTVVDVSVDLLHIRQINDLGEMVDECVIEK